MNKQGEVDKLEARSTNEYMSKGDDWDEKG